jgi:hypothetical protein
LYDFSFGHDAMFGLKYVASKFRSEPIEQIELPSARSNIHPPPMSSFIKIGSEEMFLSSKEAFLLNGSEIGAKLTYLIWAASK